MNTTLYRMYDPAPAGVIEVSPTEAQAWNKRAFGIFWTVNSFHGPRRIENLKRINAWAVDMDKGTKAEMRARLESKHGLVPSRVVETKRGYQAYWFAKDAKPEHWNAIVLDRLVPFYGADRNARDLARILRVPGYLHCKDPASPFLVRTVHEYDVWYTTEQIALRYPVSQRILQDRAKHKQAQEEAGISSDPLWDRIFHLDCEQALTSLSGTGVVSGEHYTFCPTRRGTSNIFVDGKGTSCWIDANGRIGSLDRGGPTIAQWLRWFGHSWGEVLQILQQFFPALFDA